MVDLSQLEKVKSASDLASESARTEAIAYLRSTDWYVIRKVETGKEVPDDISTLRSEARSLLQ